MSLDLKPPRMVYNMKKRDTYQRINHFRDWLLHIQCQDDTIVPRAVIQEVRMEIDALHITEAQDVTYMLVRKILKRINQSVYYENIYQIIHTLTDESFQIGEDTYSELCRMFFMVQAPYERLKPYGRKSFFSYPFILHKFFLLLDMRDEAQRFVLLKDQTKLHRHELLFQSICHEVGWDYHKTI